MLSLYDLKRGETATITSLGGSGSFKARLGELGFVPGQSVTKLYSAPMGDPVVFEVLGSQVALRAQEAKEIQANTESSNSQPHSTPLPRREGRGGESPAKGVGLYFSHHHCSGVGCNAACPYCHHEGHTAPDDHAREGDLTIALVGNPNCGKTSLFNAASGGHERTGNYSGVTVRSIVGRMDFEGRSLRIIDLPGTYSLRAYSPEEAYVAYTLETEPIDAIINVLDSGNLERNLLLTMQLRRRGLPVLGALNMFDELEGSGGNLDIEALSSRLNMPMIPTVGRTGKGIPELLRAAVAVGDAHRNCPAFVSDDCLADDDDQDDTDRYAEIRSILDGIYERRKGAMHHHTALADKIMARHWYSYILFVCVMALIFWLTFTIGQYPMDWIDSFVGWTGEVLGQWLPDGMLKDLLVDGILGGVGAVIVFLPNILILYFLISLLEDSGYLARAAMLADPLFRRAGLHGKSFIPLLMGFGCNMPAVMSTRIIENAKNRRLTMLVIPFMSCSARIPIYVLFAAAFFPACATWVMLALYIFGVLMALTASSLLNRFYHPHEETHFVMELPPYRRPTANSVLHHTWEQGRQYLHKMGTVILGASIIIWLLGYFPRATGPSLTPPVGGSTAAQEQLSTANSQLSTSLPTTGGAGKGAQMEQSYLGRIGHALEPVFAPQGFDWRMDVGIVAGIGAKEMMVGTLGVIYNCEADEAADIATVEEAEGTRLSAVLREHTSPSAALAYLVFALLYFPCIATVTAIVAESGSWRYGIFVAVYTTLVAYVVSALVALIF